MRFFVVIPRTLHTMRAVPAASHAPRFHPGLHQLAAWLDRPIVLASFAAVLSNLVSNVPAVMVFKPLIPHLVDAKKAWLVLAMSSTLAGNLTVLGSVANLIVIQRSHRQAEISFWEYFKAGAPLTAVSIALGLLILR